MQLFSEAFNKAREVVLTQKFDPAWQRFLDTDGCIRELFSSKGPMARSGVGARKIAKKIIETSRKNQVSTGETILAAAQNGALANNATDRAATLKMARHMHRTHTRGAQNVWVYSPPQAHASWIFDELTGNDTNDAMRLSQDEELFSAEEIKWMMSSLTMALKIAETVKHKLASLAKADAKTIQLVKDWFLDETCGDVELGKALIKLHQGFKKIASACNSSRLVFTDYPDWRAQRATYFGGAIPGGEGCGFPVIYLEGAFIRLTGNSGKIWLCAETIIHEMSHHQVCTTDHRYDDRGLKPNSTTHPFAKALDNADNWGYFALDLAGFLSGSDRLNVLK